MHTEGRSAPMHAEGRSAPMHTEGGLLQCTQRKGLLKCTELETCSLLGGASRTQPNIYDGAFAKTVNGFPFL